MKNFKLFIALIVFASIISCNNKRKPQLEYMPDMYVSVPYDANGAEGINNKPVNSEPVAGTIPRGGHPAYDIPDTAEGYDKAKAELKNPLEASEENLEKGKALYEIYCISCHGKKGDGNGYLSQAEKFEGIPSYKDRDINAGSIYHVIMHGKNLMGSHSSQLTYNERWQIIHYVENLRAEL
ncbi:c-type cytochrome [Polaribacter reichenbachii]|nr:cytochrome c [Polaribacter reichenbachii]